VMFNICGVLSTAVHGLTGISGTNRIVTYVQYNP